MFYSSELEGQDADSVTAIGTFARSENGYVILNTDGHEIKIEHCGLENYQSKAIAVTGSLCRGVLMEEKVYNVEDDFNFESYSRLLRVSRKYQNVF